MTTAKNEVFCATVATNHDEIATNRDGLALSQRCRDSSRRKRRRDSKN